MEKYLQEAPKSDLVITKLGKVEDYQTATIGKFCSMMGMSHRFAILEWGSVNPKKISAFLQRMKVNQKFRTYGFRFYDALRLLYRRIYDESLETVIQVEKHWSSKLDHVLEEERGALECCEEEILARRSRVTWLEQIKADYFQDRNLWRSGLVPLPVWKRKVKKQAKRKANNPAPTADKRQRIEEPSMELKESSPGRRVRLVSDSDEGESWFVYLNLRVKVIRSLDLV